MDFFSWDDEWGDASGMQQAEPVHPVRESQPETLTSQPVYEEKPVVEAAPVQQHVEQPTNDWYADEWGASTGFESEEVKQPVVPEPVPVPEPEVVAPQPRAVAPQPRAVAPQPRAVAQPRAAPQTRNVAPAPKTNSWGKDSTSLFTNNKQPKQTKQKKAPQKKQKHSEEKKRPASNKSVQKKPAQPVVESTSKNKAALVAENQTLRQEVTELQTTLESMNTRLLHLEHSKHLLYNSVCNLNSHGGTHENRIIWTSEYGGDVLPFQLLAYELTEDGTGVRIMMNGLYEISFNTYGSNPQIQMNQQTYATGHTNNSSAYLSICVYVENQPIITCHAENVVEGNACDHWLSIRRFPS